MKLTMATMYVAKALEQLLEEAPQEVYGLQIIERCGLPSGTVYPILRRMEDGGMLEVSMKEAYYSHCGRRAQHHYALTDSGRAFLIMVNQRLQKLQLRP